MKLDKIAFLINPKSGTKGTQRQAAALEEWLKQHAPNALLSLESPEDMATATLELAQKNYKAVFACGGDGTLNLISGKLLGTETALGIIPLGSGNGFARHHAIPLQWHKALAVVENPVVSVRDTGIINGLHFLNIAGLGFAAKISHAFKDQTRRGLAGYAETVVKNLKLDPFPIRIQNENGMWQGEAWMVDFCNGSQWGNNFRLDPGARDDDGTLSAVIFKKMNPLKLPVLGFRFASNQVQGSADVYSFTGAGFRMEFEGKKPLHVDGEAIGFAESAVEVFVNPGSLKIWTF